MRTPSDINGEGKTERRTRDKGGAGDSRFQRGRAAPIEADDFRFQTDRVGTIAAAHAVHDTYTAFLPALLPVLINKLLLSKTEAGLLSVFLQAPSFLQPFIGHLADRHGLRLVVVFAPAVSGAMMSLLGWTSGTFGYVALAALLTVAGISSAGLHAVAPVMAGRYSGRSLGRGMGFWMVGGELGRTLGPIVIVTAIAFLTLEGTALLMIIGFATSALLFVRLKDAPAQTARSQNPLDWRPALKRMRSLMIPLFLLIFTRSFMTISLTIYLPTFLTEEGASLWVAGAALSVLELSGIVGALTGGSLSDRLGHRRVLLLATLTTPIFLYLFLNVRGWVLFPVLLLSGFTLLSTVPVVMALVQESFPENRALANGVYMLISFLVRSAAVVIVGVIGDLVGLRWAFAISGVLMWAGVPLIFLLPTPPNRH